MFLHPLYKTDDTQAYFVDQWEWMHSLTLEQSKSHSHALMCLNCSKVNLCIHSSLISSGLCVICLLIHLLVQYTSWNTMYILMTKSHKCGLSQIHRLNVVHGLKWVQNKCTMPLRGAIIGPLLFCVSRELHSFHVYFSQWTTPNPQTRFNPCLWIRAMGLWGQRIQQHEMAL